jgi:hypothetical protein
LGRFVGGWVDGRKSHFFSGSRHHDHGLLHGFHVLRHQDGWLVSCRGGHEFLMPCVYECPKKNPAPADSLAGSKTFNLGVSGKSEQVNNNRN